MIIMADEDAESMGVIDLLRKSIMGPDRDTLIFPITKELKPATFVQVTYGEGFKKIFFAGTKSDFAILRINHKKTGRIVK
jgi:hypothetical protein